MASNLSMCQPHPGFLPALTSPGGSIPLPVGPGSLVPSVTGKIIPTHPTYISPFPSASPIFPIPHCSHPAQRHCLSLCTAWSTHPPLALAALSRRAFQSAAGHAPSSTPWCLEENEGEAGERLRAEQRPCRHLQPHLTPRHSPSFPPGNSQNITCFTFEALILI